MMNTLNNNIHTGSSNRIYKVALILICFITFCSLDFHRERNRKFGKNV